MFTIAIIGSGPTAIYTLRYLLKQKAVPLNISLFEAQAQAGKGTPYHPDWNDPAMLSNIASIEIPPVTETLVHWLQRQSDAALHELQIARDAINAREFFPRLVLGEYFQAQLTRLLEKAKAHGHTVTLKTEHEVLDVMLRDDGIRLAIRDPHHDISHALYSHVVMATGHVWPEKTEIRPGYFLAPWPVSQLSTIGQCHVGIRGTSLSAIDAMVALSIARGAYERDETGRLHYAPEPGTYAFHITMLSRKGLLPEADFYHPIPYTALAICTPEAVDDLIEANAPNLLDKVFALFKAELAACDPAYAHRIQLHALALEQFCEVYFQERAHHDPFTWAEKNLTEASLNQAHRITVPWRYAILRMHEVVGRIVPALTAEDHARFNRHFKQVFVDDYATVPHESIERVLALHRAGKLEILAVGEEYTLDTKLSEGGATLTFRHQQIHFPAFIEAMGQRSLSAHDFPFPSLRRQGVVRNATAPHKIELQQVREFEKPVDIGGIALDETYHPLSHLPYASQLYCLSLPFMLSQFPFAQGITSSHSMGRQVAKEMLHSTSHDKRFEPRHSPLPFLANEVPV